MRINLIFDKGFYHPEMLFKPKSNASDFHLLFTQPQFVNGITGFTLSVFYLIPGYFILITLCQLPYPKLNLNF